MAVGFRYSAMTVTGALHLTLGIICVIISIVGLSVDTYTYEKSYSFDEVKYVIYEFPSKGTATGSFIASLGVIAAGIIGIMTGQRSNPEGKTRKLGRAYLALTILSASLFSVAGLACFATTASFSVDSTNQYLAILFIFGAFLMFLEFVISIISSSICCCCSEIKGNGVVAQTSNLSSDRLISPAVYSPNVAGTYMPPQGPSYPPNVAGTYMPPQGTSYPPNVAGTYMPPQGTSYPPNVAGTHMPPQGTYPPNVAGTYIPLQEAAHPPNVAGAQMFP